MTPPPADGSITVTIAAKHVTELECAVIRRAVEIAIDTAMNLLHLESTKQVIVDHWSPDQPQN